MCFGDGVVGTLAVLGPARVTKPDGGALEPSAGALFALREIVFPLLPAAARARAEFLPLMLTSVFCAALVLALWVEAGALMWAASTRARDEDDDDDERAPRAAPRAKARRA